MSIHASSRATPFVVLVVLTTAVPVRAQNGYSFLDAPSSRVGCADASYFASAGCEALVSRTTHDFSIKYHLGAYGVSRVRDAPARRD